MRHKNISKVQLNVKVGEMVYVKNNANRKQDLLFSGPHEVLQIESDNNGVLLRINNKQQWINTRNIFRA